MKITSLLFFAFLLIQLTSLAQAPDTSWTKAFGGSGIDKGYAVQQTTDGGYIITGFTSSFFAVYQDVYLVKTNASGNIIWAKTFGGSEHDYGVSVQQTTDGGYIVTGSTYSYGAGDEDVYLIKTNASGDTLWTKTFGGSKYDHVYAVQQTTDGGYIITGYTFSYGAGRVDVYLIKTNASGDTLWTKTFGGVENDFGYAVQQTTDGGYIITGSTYSYGAGRTDVWLIKTNASGDTLWTKTFGGADSDDGYAVQQTTDGGYIITGSTSSYGAGRVDVYLIKTNASGNIIWDKTFGGDLSDEGSSVQQTTDEGYIVTGSTYSYGAGNADIWIIKTNTSGKVIWDKTFGGVGDDYGNSVQQTTDGGYIIVGSTSSFGAGQADVWLIKTNGSILEK